MGNDNFSKRKMFLFKFHFGFYHISNSVHPSPSPLSTPFPTNETKKTMTIPQLARRGSKPQIISLPLFLLFLIPLSFYLILFRTHSSLLLTSPKTPVLTLLFDSSYDSPYVEHNCALLTAQQARFIIYTDSTKEAYCQVCECVVFTPTNCTCPNPGEPACNHCEKLFFLIRRLGEFEEFVFLDSDVVIMKEEFLGKLLVRAQLEDMLGSRGHAGADIKKYYEHFNSGVLFLRRIDGVNYGEMVKMMYEGKRNRDQGVVSDFVFKYYRNWDRLSLKWHCRGLEREGYDIPVKECLTFHDREESEKVFREIGFEMRRIGKGDKEGSVGGK